MTAAISKTFTEAIRMLEKSGVLLIHGSEIPDVCSLVTRRRIRGSWWADPESSQIFTVSEMLAAHADVTVTKLISAKVTLVHRKLWPKLVAIGTAREEWQLRDLSPQAKLLLQHLDKAASLQTNRLGSKFGKRPGDTARELELRLLIHADQIHTEQGLHAKVLETWTFWASRVGIKSKTVESLKARNYLEKRIAKINKACSGSGKLPWQPRQKSVRATKLYAQESLY